MIRPEVVQQLSCPSFGLATSWIITQKGVPAESLEAVKTHFRREFWPFPKTVCAKDDSRAKKLRENANEYYKKDPADVEKVLRFYNESICNATEGSDDIGMGYANRSAVYFNQKQYRKCLINIELAKANNYPGSKMDKLLEREKRCLNMLDGEDINGNNEYTPMRIESTGSNLKIAEIPECGRGLVTIKDLKVGEIALLEKPVLLVVEPEANYSRCNQCGCKNDLDLIPCKTCSVAMYCSKQCRDDAFNRYHRFECEIGEDLKYLFRGPKVTRMFQLTLRLLWIVVADLIENPEQFRHRYTEQLGQFQNPLEMESSKIHLHILAAKLPHVSSDQTGKGVTQILTVLIYKVAIEENVSVSSCIHNEDLNLLLEILYKLILLGKRICDQSVEDLTCLYPLLRMVNHSCAPNAERVSFSGQSALMIKRPIKAGEQITVSYFPNGTSDTEVKDKRKDLLQKEFQFDCQCLGCALDYPLISAVEENVDLAKELEAIQSKEDDEKLRLLEEFMTLNDHQYPQTALAEAWTSYRQERINRFKKNVI